MKELNQAIELMVIYLQGIWLRRRYIVVTAWLICGVGWLFIFQLPPTYQAEAKVYVETRSVLDPVLSGLTFQSNPQQQVELMARTLLSRPNLEKISRETDMDVVAKSSEEYEDLIDDLKTDIKMTSAGRTNIYVISYSNASSALALKVVQETLDTFVESQVGSFEAESRTAKAFLDQQIADYEKRLTAAESRLSSFKKEQQLVGPTKDVGFYEKIEAESKNLEEVRLTLEQLQSQLDSARRQLKGELRTSFQKEGTSSSQYDGRITLLENQLDSLLIRYTEQHPDVIETRRLLESLKSMRTDELQQFALQLESGDASSISNENVVYQELRLSVAKLENDIESFRVRERRSLEKLELLQSQRNVIPDIEAKLAGLNRDYEVTKKKHEELISRREQMNLSQQAKLSTQDVQFKIVEPPRVPINASGPNRMLFYSIVLALGVISGLLAAFLRSQLQPVVISSLQLKNITDFPVFGIVSHLERDEYVKQNRKHLLYFLLLSGVLVLVYSILMANELVFGISINHVWAVIA